MAVLVEGISVVVLREGIDRAYPGGWQRFVDDCPNRTLCADSYLARVGFMTPVDVEGFVHRLEACGLIFQKGGETVDIAVVDQLEGPTFPCRWLQFGHVEISGHLVAAARHADCLEMVLITPDGWRYEESLTTHHTFVPTDQVEERMQLLQKDGSMDVYLDFNTGKEGYTGRVFRGGRSDDSEASEGAE